MRLALAGPFFTQFALEQLHVYRKYLGANTDDASLWKSECARDQYRLLYSMNGFRTGTGVEEIVNAVASDNWVAHAVNPYTRESQPEAPVYLYRHTDSCDHRTTIQEMVTDIGDFVASKLDVVSSTPVQQSRFLSSLASLRVDGSTAWSYVDYMHRVVPLVLLCVRSDSNVVLEADEVVARVFEQCLLLFRDNRFTVRVEGEFEFYQQGFRVNRGQAKTGGIWSYIPGTLVAGVSSIAGFGTSYAHYRGAVAADELWDIIKEYPYETIGIASTALIVIGGGVFYLRNRALANEKIAVESALAEAKQRTEQAKIDADRAMAEAKERTERAKIEADARTKAEEAKTERARLATASTERMFSMAMQGMVASNQQNMEVLTNMVRQAVRPGNQRSQITDGGPSVAAIMPSTSSLPRITSIEDQVPTDNHEIEVALSTNRGNPATGVTILTGHTHSSSSGAHVEEVDDEDDIVVPQRDRRDIAPVPQTFEHKEPEGLATLARTGFMTPSADPGRGRTLHQYDNIHRELLVETSPPFHVTRRQRALDYPDPPLTLGTRSISRSRSPVRTRPVPIPVQVEQVQPRSTSTNMGANELILLAFALHLA